MLAKIGKKRVIHFFILVCLIISAVYVYNYNGQSTVYVDKSAKVFYDFYDHFDDAKIVGNLSKSDNPWGNTIAKIILDGENKNIPYYNKKGLFAHPVSELSFNILVPEKEKLVFKSVIGIHPIASTWGSDGFRMKVDVISDNVTKNVFDRYVNSKDGLKEIQVKLYEYAGKKVDIKLSTSNDKDKNAVADWAVWIEPQLLSK